MGKILTKSFWVHDDDDISTEINEFLEDMNNSIKIISIQYGGCVLNACNVLIETALLIYEELDEK